jgi:hypothetical protein
MAALRANGVLPAACAIAFVANLTPYALITIGVRKIRGIAKPRSRLPPEK